MTVLMGAVELFGAISAAVGAVVLSLKLAGWMFRDR